MSQKASHTTTQGGETTSSSTCILQKEACFEKFFKLAATETLALFEHLEFDFLEEFDGFDLDGAVIIHFECLLPIVRTPDPNTYISEF